MLRSACLCVLLIAVTPGWSQLGVVPYEVPTKPNTDQMSIPPPISSERYPTLVGSELRSNYVSAGVLLKTAYDDNVVAGSSNAPISDMLYTVTPTITFNKTTSRQNTLLSFSPGFTFFQHTSELNSSNQSASLDFRYRLSEHTTLSLNDAFQKSSNIFDQLYPSSGVGISGSAQATPANVIAPYAEFLMNAANIGLSSQFSRDGMIGASGIFTDSIYPNTAQASGFYNSSSRGGSAFFNRRISERQYTGVIYEYMRTLANPASAQANSGNMQVDVQTQSFLGFYTIYLNPTLSLSVSCGPQYFDVSQLSLPPTRSWAPSGTASIGWQRTHSNFAASYSKTVTGSNGLIGAFDSNKANASLRWQMAKLWTGALTGIYFVDRNVAPSTVSTPGGHTISASFSIQRPVGEHVTAEIGYARLHQSYANITAIADAPGTDRVYVSLSYQVTRSLGR